MTEKRKFLKWELTFHEPVIEYQFRNSLSGFKQKGFRLYLISVLIAFSLNWIVNPLDPDNLSGTRFAMNLISIVFLLFSTVLVFYLKRKFKYYELGVLILQLYACIAFIESSQILMPKYSKTNFITVSFALELSMMIPMVLRCSWKFNCISASVSNTYLLIRWCDFPENDQKAISSFVFFGNSVFMIISSYSIEKYDRKIFYKRFNDETTLQYLVDIMKKNLPNSLIIYKEESLYFHNDETNRLLQIGPGESVEGKIKKIMLTPAPSNNEIFINFLEGKGSSKPSDNNLFEKSYYLNDLLTNKHAFEKEKEFLRLPGIYRTIKEEENILTADTKKQTLFLEIKIGKITWKGDDAILAIISEDFTARRMRELEEQAEYKDNLLATVSHDLRTPLNGVIGILDLVLESVLEKALRKR